MNTKTKVRIGVISAIGIGDIELTVSNCQRKNERARSEASPIHSLSASTILNHLALAPLTHAVHVIREATGIR
jgi:hypothetical protein